MIRLTKVSRIYQDGARSVKALDGVGLDIPVGCVAALTGKSGSGKSTLLHLMGGLEWPSEGRVTVAGVNLDDLNDRALTRFRLTTIGFVFQFFHLLPSLSVLENLTLPAELASISLRNARSKAAHLLEEVGLPQLAGTYPERLSAGEQQRVAIARGLMMDPPILLADEPTGNLDSETGQQIIALIHRLAGERGMTVILASHSPELVAQCPHRIELHDGRIIHDDTGSGSQVGPHPRSSTGKSPICL